jgi:hypothetical protein
MIKIYLSLFLCFFVGCSKEYEDNSGYNDQLAEDLQNELYNYSIIDGVDLCYATKNVPGLGSNKWIANGFAYKSRSIENTFEFFFDTVNNLNDKYYRESLGVTWIPQKVGRTILKSQINEKDISIHDSKSPESQLIRILDDGDVGGRGWHISRYNESFFSIDKIDSLKKKIYISFDIYFDYERKFYEDQRKKGVDWPPFYWSKNINFLGGRAVLNLPK